MQARVPLSAQVFLALITAATLTGCSTADGTADTPGSEQPSVTVTARAKALIEAELRALVLQEAELPEARPGGISVQDRGDPADHPSFKPASDPDCQKVHDISDATTASAVVEQVINWKDGVTAGGVTLASFDDGETVRLFVELERAVRSCGTYQGDALTGAYTATMKAQKAPEVGDEAVRFRERSTIEVGKRDDLHIVVRTGNVIAVYHSVDFGRTPTFPTGPIIKQTERLRDAQSG